MKLQRELLLRPSKQSDHKYYVLFVTNASSKIATSYVYTLRLLFKEYKNLQENTDCFKKPLLRLTSTLQRQIALSRVTSILLIFYVKKTLRLP